MQSQQVSSQSQKGSPEQKKLNVLRNHEWHPKVVHNTHLQAGILLCYNILWVFQRSDCQRSRDSAPKQGLGRAILQKKGEFQLIKLGTGFMSSVKSRPVQVKSRETKLQF
jgi:hypothetical protein